MVLTQTPYYFRIARSSVLQVMSEDFITTFKATGMKESRIFNRVRRNDPADRYGLGMSLAFLLSGSVLIENRFRLAGYGPSDVQLDFQRDYPVLTGIYLVTSVVICIAMILVDILSTALSIRGFATTRSN